MLLWYAIIQYPLRYAHACANALTVHYLEYCYNHKYAPLLQLNLLRFQCRNAKMAQPPSNCRLRKKPVNQDVVKYPLPFLFQYDGQVTHLICDVVMWLVDVLVNALHSLPHKFHRLHHHRCLIKVLSLFPSLCVATQNPHHVQNDETNLYANHIDARDR